MTLAVPPGSTADPITADDVVALLKAAAVTAVFQPIVAVADGSIVAYEALARMAGRVPAPPNVWLEAAEDAGLRTELELLCLQAALAHGLPPGGARLFVNLSPSVLADPRTAFLVPRDLASRLVFELSETEAILDYEAVRRSMETWTAMGTHLAIDDTGSGYASLRHVIQLNPGVIKLDRSLVEGISRDRNRRALVAALVAFSRELGAEVVAEGVETAEELATLDEAGVELVQGYLLARPGPPWASAPARPGTPGTPGKSGTPVVGEDRIEVFRQRLGEALDAPAACRAATDLLAHLPGVMPSAYLLQGDRLRCQSQRGLWQVLDGLRPGVGITGRCFVEQREQFVPDVLGEPGYREAVPGIRSEACVPVRVEGMTVGVLNIDSRRALDEDDLAMLRLGASLLGDRLGDLGRSPARSPFGQLGTHIRALDAATDRERRADALVLGSLDVSGLDTGAVVWTMPGDHRHVLAATGPLRQSLVTLADERYAELQRLVAGTTSCYTAGRALGEGFVGFDALRDTGVRTMVVAPLGLRERRRGLLLLAGTTTGSLGPAEIEPVETLCAHATALLAAPTFR